MAASPDLLREMIKGFAQRIMDAGVETICNAGYGEVTTERENSRNGYRAREWDLLKVYAHCIDGQAPAARPLSAAEVRCSTRCGLRFAWRELLPDLQGGESDIGTENCRRRGEQCYVPLPKYFRVIDVRDAQQLLAAVAEC